MDALEINRSADLVALASQDTELRRSGAWYIGGCPFCGGRDRFNIKRTPEGERWFCRKCGGGRYHTPIDYVMRRDSLDFKAALERLGGEAHLPVPVSAAQPARPARRPARKLPSAEWQAAAWKEVDEAAAALIGGDDRRGRDYLHKRGLHRATWLPWRLGFARVFDPTLRCKRPAIVLPWTEVAQGCDLITAIKYRFVDEVPGGLRYIARRGSVPVLFGMTHAVPGQHSLLLVEGELNALSVWQCLPLGVACISFGSETGGRPEVLRALSMSYRRVVVWADDPERAKSMLAMLRQGPQAMESPRRAGLKLDANAMLQEGALAGFLSALFGVECVGRREV